MKHQFQPQPIPRLLRQLAGSVLLLTLLFTSCKKKEDGLHMDGDKLELVSGKKTETVRLADVPGAQVSWQDNQWKLAVLPEYGGNDPQFKSPLSARGKDAIRFKQGFMEIKQADNQIKTLDLNYLEGVFLNYDKLTGTNEVTYACSNPIDLEEEIVALKQMDSAMTITATSTKVNLTGVAGTWVIEDNAIEDLFATIRNLEHFRIRGGIDWKNHVLDMGTHDLRARKVTNTLPAATMKTMSLQASDDIHTCYFPRQTHDILLCDGYLYIGETNGTQLCRLKLREQEFHFMLTEEYFIINGLLKYWGESDACLQCMTK